MKHQHDALSIAKFQSLYQEAVLRGEPAVMHTLTWGRLEYELSQVRRKLNYQYVSKVFKFCDGNIINMFWAIKLVKPILKAFKLYKY